MNTINTAARPAARMSVSMPNLFLRIEGLSIFLACIAGYIYIGASGWLFILLILAPDLGMLGYLRNPCVGAVVYDLVHLMLLPLIVLLVGMFTATNLAIAIALIWIAHIGMDRIAGYGFKYVTAFKDTHMDRV